MTDQPADPTQSSVDAEDGAVPEILEVFGAAPIVEADPREGVDASTEAQTLDEGDLERFEEQLDAVSALSTDAEAQTDDQAEGSSSGSPSHDDFLDMAEALASMQGVAQLIEQRMGALEISLDGLHKQSSFLPPKLRGLGQKVDELSSVLADGRLRETMLELVGLSDLIDAGLGPRALKDDLRRTLEAVHARLGATMEGRGLMPIETDGAFDPARHQSLERRVVQDAALDGMIVEVFRRGWRDEHSVLRYADVAVGAYEEPRDEQPDEPQLDANTPADDAPLDDLVDVADDSGSNAPEADEPTDAPDATGLAVDLDNTSLGDQTAITPATLTPSSSGGGRAAPRRDTNLDASILAGVTDRTAVETSPRDDKNDNNEMDDV